jgi:hypothetical protein
MGNLVAGTFSLTCRLLRGATQELPSMIAPKEYRRFALECQNQAAETKDERLRQVWLETARLWMQTALHAERSAGEINRDVTRNQPGRS